MLDRERCLKMLSAVEKLFRRREVKVAFTAHCVRVLDLFFYLYKNTLVLAQDSVLL